MNNDQHLIDTVWLKSQYRENMQELLKIYIKENDECVSNMRQAMKNHNHDDIRAVAHKMKGSSRIVGALLIESLASIIERTFDPIILEEKVEELQHIYTRVKEEITYIIKNQ